MCRIPSQTSMTDSDRPPQKVLVRTYIDPRLLERFNAQFPMHGALSWVLALGMEAVLDLTDGQRPLEDVVRSSIKASLIRQRAQPQPDNDGNLSIEPTATGLL